MGELTFLAPDAPLRQCGTLGEDELVCTAAAPFQFKGRLSAFDIVSNAHLADFDLTGQGRGGGIFASNEPIPGQLFYDFSPVPEPSSLLLAGPLILGGALRRRVRGRSH